MTALLCSLMLCAAAPDAGAPDAGRVSAESSASAQKDAGTAKKPGSTDSDAGLAVAAAGVGGVESGSDAGTAVRKPLFAISPATPRPGDLVLITYYSDDRKLTPSGSLGDKPLHFFSFKRGFRALGPLSVDLTVGKLPLVITPAKGEPLTDDLDVVDPHFRESELKVSNKFISPPKTVKAQIAEDKKAFAAAFAQPFIAPLFTKNFAWPRPQVITAPFGDRRVFNGKLQSQHYGTDLDGHTGDEITAANDGVVVMARSCYASGNTVLIHHGIGLFTAYFHMSKMDVTEGQKVKRGEHLGLVGKTGRVTGPHLHWGVKANGMYVDAESLMRLDFEH